jgi:predicted anti-sigma-YlaC factor YlaD
VAACEQWQDAMSARLDGEDPGTTDTALDAHLAACARCREFAAAAGALDLMMGAAPAAVVPERSADIVAAVRAERRSEAWVASQYVVPRVALGLVGVMQLVTPMPFLWSPTGAHTMRDLAAFELALGVGFIVAAVRPATAPGLLPTAAALVVVLSVVVIGDIAGGRTVAAAESVHFTELIGVALLRLLTPRGPLPRRPRSA